MLISQILDDAETIRVVARSGGKTRIINGARSVYSLAMEAARTGVGLAALIERKGLRRDRRSRCRLQEGTAVVADQPSRSGASASHRHRPDASRLGGDARFHAQEAQHRRRGAAHRFHEDVPHGAGGRQARQGPDRRAAGMVLQGQRHHGRGAGRSPPVAGLRQGRRRGAGGRRHLCHRRRRRALPRRLHAVERILRPCHRARELSVPGPFQAAQRLVRAGDPDRRPAGRHSRRLAHPARRQAAVGKAVPVGRGEHVAHHRQSRAPPLQILGRSASRATCMCTCSARRRCPSPTASGPRPATCSRSRPGISACRCATRSRSSSR